MNISSIMADPTSALIAGILFSLILILVALIALLLVRRANNRTRQTVSTSRIKTISDSSQVNISRPVAKRENKNGIGLDNELGDYIQVRKPAKPDTIQAVAIPEKPEAVVAQSIPGMEKTAPAELRVSPNLVTVQNSSASQSEATVLESENIPEQKEKNDDPFSVFNEVTMEQSPTSKFAATLKDVDIHDLNRQTQATMKILKSRTGCQKGNIPQ
ncbi:hypothetical protein DGWBC_1617 [Dehalogenimonas sp. WBC-2]|nr:hypothetical protein DGWBC_1617 [Dehalogenimonas sp. WBC-2]